MDITLAKPFKDFVQLQINTGMYNSESEVIVEGLKALAIQKQQQLEQNLNKEACNEEFVNKFKTKPY